MRTRLYHHGLLISALLVVFVSWVIPSAAGAWIPPQWVDKVAMEVMVQKNMAKKGNFDSYFKQLDVISEVAVKGDYAGKRKGLNRFLEMLETKEGGITTDAAHQIVATVVKSVPYAVLLPLKSEGKLDSEEKALVDRMKRFAEGVRQQDERAALSF